MERAEPHVHLSLDAYLDALRHEIDAALADALDTRGGPPILLEAMRYSLLGGGKRLRPCLTLAAADAIAARTGLDENLARQRALPAACAVEMIHAYSLVHDDLPAMDDDALRRGRPTTHVKFGDGLAILAGDALLTEAFSLLARPLTRLDPAWKTAPSEAARLRIITRLASAAGAAGMVGGQTIDLAAAGRVPSVHMAIDRDALDEMHALKTGALIRAAVVIGALALDAESELAAALDAYARELGLAFQIIDDVLDAESKDEPSYPMLVGVEASRSIAAECCQRAKTALSDAQIGGRLAEIADWTLERRK